MTVVSPLDSRTTAPSQLRISPLRERWDEFAAAASPWVRLFEEPFLTQLNLRADPGSGGAQRLQSTLGITLPSHVSNRVSGDERVATLWLGPDEWLVVAPDGSAPEMIEAAGTVFSEHDGSLVDVSANRTTLGIAGPRAREVLAKVCSLDLHPRAFGPGQCSQTLVGRTQAIVWQVRAEPAYRLLVRSSFADYLADLLLDASAEFST